MDPDNPVVKLCAQGMEAEFAGRADDARQLFQQAWDAAQDDYEACIAAHYLARSQPTFDDNLHWNQVALAHADAVADERVREFYPSLYLNLGHSYEITSDLPAARIHYELAAERVAMLPAGPYGDMVRRGVANAVQRIDALTT
jgi:hypothetical protein